MVHNKITAMGLALIVGMISSMAFSATKLKFNEGKTFVKEIKLKGDLRLRHENFDNSGTSIDRQRQRIRFRQAIDFKLPHNLKIKTRFASGGSEQTSTNQTLDNNSTPKAFAIDRVFLEWKPIDIVKLQVGKVKNPFWGPYSRDVMFDSDYNPEGASQHVGGLVGPVDLSFTAGQFVLEEKGSSLEDAYMFSEQVTAEVKLPAESRFKGAIAHHELTNVRQRNRGSNGSGGGDIGGVGSFATNSSSAPFSILQLSGIVSSWIFGKPVSVEATYLQNMAAPKVSIGGATAQEQDTAIQAGLRVGKAKKKGTLEVAYFWKEVDRDASVAGIADADFPNTTNAKGHVGWISYAITDFIKATVKHFDAELKRVSAGSLDGSVNRTQFDLVTKF